MRKIWLSHLEWMPANPSFFSSHPGHTDKIRAFNPDLIITRSMPKYADLGPLLEELKSDSELYETPVLLITGLQDADIPKGWNPRYIDAILPSPFSKTTLEKTLYPYLLGKVRQEREKPLAVLVDDSDTILTVMEKQVRALGFDTVKARDGADGLKKIIGLLPDIVITDIEMPSMDGSQMCRELSGLSATSHLPIIVVSSTVNEETRRKTFQHGVIDALPKPVDVTRLKRAMERAMRSHERRDRGYAVVLEDSPLIATSIRKLFAESGIAAYTCSTIAELDHFLTLMTPDIITVDISLPDGSGLALCHRLRGQAKYDHVPIIVISGESHTETMVASLEAGANDFLRKPFSREEFTVRIRNLMENKLLLDELMRKTRALENLAYNDGLTTLFNRRFFDEKLATVVEEAIGRDQPLSLLLLDLDHFKSVNDTYGHETGDIVLKEVARRVNDSIRGTDTACRYGGEEFVVILPNCSMPEAKIVARRILDSCSAKPISKAQLTQTVSIGLACSASESTMSDLVAHADKALYASKKNGRNQFTVYSPDELM